MLKRYLFLFLVLCCTLSAVSQDDKKPLAEQLQLLQKSKADTNRVNFLNELSTYYFDNPASKTTGTDSALFYATAAEALSNQLKYSKGLGNSYISLSRIWRNKKDIARGKEYVNKAITVFQNAHLFTDLGYALFELSGYYELSGAELTGRIKIVEAALAAFRKDGNIKKESDCLKELADVRQIEGNYKQAYDDLKLSLQLKQSIKDTNLLGVYDLLCDVATSLGNFNEAIQYGFLAIKTAEKSKNNGDMSLCAVYNHIGIAYYYQGDLESSAVYLQKALQVAKANYSLNDVTYITFSYANILTRLKRYADAVGILKDIQKNYPGMVWQSKINVACGFVTNYCFMEKLDSATPYYNQLQALNVAKGLPNEIQRVVYYADAVYLLATKQYKKVRPVLDAQEKYLATNGTLLQLSYNQLHWFKLDSAEGKLASAIEHFKKYKTLNDSLYTQTKSKQIEQLKIQYETDQKDKDIQLKQKNIELLTKQALLQQTNLRQTQLVRNITLAGIALLLIIIGLLYSRYRLKQKSSQQINQQNISLQRLVAEKEWLLKEIHHRVKNNFHMVMGLLGTQSGYLKNEEAVSTMEESRHRINAMSLIHQKLYQSVDFSAINMRDYIHELVDYLRDSFDTRQRILFKMEIESISLDITHSIPLGLILNEAITNSIKYAFPGNADGVVNIVFEHTTGNQLQLTVHDNGIGIEPTFANDRSLTMGMNLMQGLCEDIGGSFTIAKQDGTLITIIFMYDPVVSKKNLPELSKPVIAV